MKFNTDMYNKWLTRSAPPPAPTSHHWLAEPGNGEKPISPRDAKNWCSISLRNFEDCSRKMTAIELANLNKIRAIFQKDAVWDLTQSKLSSSHIRLDYVHTYI